MKPEKDKPAPKKQSNGRVFDVRRPGKAPATPAFKPVIVGHKPEAQQAQTAVSGIGEARPLLNKGKIQLFPSADFEGQQTEQPATKAEPSLQKEKLLDDPDQQTQEDKGAGTTVSLNAVAGPPALPEANAPSTAPAETSGIPVKTDSTTEEPLPPKADKSQEPELTTSTLAAAPAEPRPKNLDPDLTDRELAKEMPEDSSSVPDSADLAPPASEETTEDPVPEPKIEPLFDDSGRIVVSQHNHRSHHGAKVMILLMVIILLAAAAVNIALDLELIELDLPHSDFF